MCQAPLQYNTTTDICLLEFSHIFASSDCPFDPKESVLVIRNDEFKATQIVNQLNSIGANAECRGKAVPFLCLHLFGLCVESGVSIQPTAGQCEEIRDITCQEEWGIIASDLPDCVTFPSASTSSCTTINNIYTTNGTITGNMSGKLIKFNVSIIENVKGLINV